MQGACLFQDISGSAYISQGQSDFTIVQGFFP